MVALPSKLRAAGLHLCVTIATALMVWQLILFWYPGELINVMNGVAIYKILMVVELALGPLMSIIIYAPSKSLKELCIDYCIVGLIQLSALAYGLFTIAEARPSFLVLARDRIEIVRPIDIDKKNLTDVSGSQFELSVFSSVRSVCVNLPADTNERRALLMSALSGNDIHRLPKYYRDCAPNEWRKGAKSLSLLFSKMDLVRKFNGAKFDTDRCGWYQLTAPTAVKTAVVCEESNVVTHYLDFDPQ